MHSTWFILREPGCVPELKGPFEPSQVKGFLLELFSERRTAFVTVLTLGEGCPTVQDGPECLEMLDRRFRFRAARHRERTVAAFAAHAARRA
jgi:hypothetical protein